MLGKKYNISVKGKHTFLIVWIQVADTIYKQLTVKINSVWSGFFGVFWYRSIDLQVYLFFCYESKPFCHPNINFNVRLESLKSVYRGREQHGNGREAGDKGTGSGRVRYGRREVLTPLSPPTRNYGINCFILSPTFFILSILSKHLLLNTLFC